MCSFSIHPRLADSEIVTLRRTSDASIAAARESFSISLGSLEEAVRSLDETSEVPAFATIGKKPSVPKRRPVSMSGEYAIVNADAILEMPSWKRHREVKFNI